MPEQQLELPLDANRTVCNPDLLAAIDRAAIAGDYPATIAAIQKFTRHVWDIFFRRDLNR
jgi:hypothetical protein